MVSASSACIGSQNRGSACELAGAAAAVPAQAPFEYQVTEAKVEMDTITTTLERQWFAEIVDRKKRVEYREIKPYWTSRLSKVRTPSVWYCAMG